jgi:hypothetical protein
MHGTEMPTFGGTGTNPDNQVHGTKEGISRIVRILRSGFQSRKASALLIFRLSARPETPQTDRMRGTKSEFRGFSGFSGQVLRSQTEPSGSLASQVDESRVTIRCSSCP